MKPRPALLTLLSSREGSEPYIDDDDDDDDDADDDHPYLPSRPTYLQTAASMMEFSSPLAAMHPPAYPAWGSRRDLPAARWATSQSFGANSFDFKELSMKKPAQPDYFTLRPVRGSSPTASLAADLSSNFHIDQSPQIPTPRRSLFGQNLFLPQMQQTDHLATPPVDYDEATTPPIPSSSPGIDMMDISPLPHKQPCFIARVTLPSPSPELSAEDDDMLSCHEVLPAPVSRLVPMPERRRTSLLRPSLTRSKGYSTTSIPQKTSSSELQQPAFKFGNGNMSGLTCSSTPTLLECSESPSADRKPLNALNFVCPPPRRTSIGNSRANGSPLVKKSAPIRAPPRKQVRRSLSMFQHPDEVMKDESQTFQPLQTPPITMELDEPYKQKLPHFVSEDEPDSLPRIQQDTLVNVLNGNYNSHYDKIVVVDCRFEYEYNGGHIDGALNFNNKEELTSKLFDEGPSSNTLLIFHCEYSELRAPRMAKFVRNRDRAFNDFQYPKLTYPEMYILDGGYSKFFANHRTMCFPQNYVEMQHKDHERECERGMGKLKQRAKLNRAQTFAFGQQSCHMEDSPTAGSRLGSRSLSTFDYNTDNSPLGQTLFRRLASY
ncbi:hypothetical protein MBLNU459_g2172t2 [Dothideomycetes sp. NU459]